MNQAVKEALAILVRQALIGLGASLGVSGVLTPFLGELTNYVVAALLVLGAAGWSQIVQLFKRRKLVQALEHANLTEKTVEGMVKSKDIITPSVLSPTNEVPS
jgi:hypothetical protein